MTGTEKWRFKTGDEVRSSPAVSNNIVYVGSNDNNLYAIDAVSGKEIWRFTTGNSVSSSPAVSNGVIYFRCGNTLYGVGGDSSNLVITQTTAPTRTMTPNPTTDTNGESPSLWDRNILIYLILVVFVLLLGALLYDTYYKKKK